MDFYTPLKFIHILAAIVAFGTNITYTAWYARLNEQNGLHTLKTIAFLDNRIANPAYGLALASGIGMAFIGNLWNQLWIHLALGLFVLVLILAMAGYTPTLKAQIRTFQEDGADSQTFHASLQRGQILGGILTVLVLAIVGLMVFRPS